MSITTKKVHGVWYAYWCGSSHVFRVFRPTIEFFHAKGRTRSEAIAASNRLWNKAEKAFRSQMLRARPWS